MAWEAAAPGGKLSVGVRLGAFLTGIVGAGLDARSGGLAPSPECCSLSAQISAGVWPHREDCRTIPHPSERSRDLLWIWCSGNNKNTSRLPKLISRYK